MSRRHNVCNIRIFDFQDASIAFKFVILLQELGISYNCRYCAATCRVVVRAHNKICDCLSILIDVSACLVRHIVSPPLGTKVLQFKFDSRKAAKAFLYLLRNVMNLTANITKRKNKYVVYVNNGIEASMKCMFIIEALGWGYEKILWR